MMYQVRQFKPALYLLVLLGITGFAIASQSPGLWLFAVVATLLNFWLVRTGQFKPMPRLVANATTILCIVLLTWMVRFSASTPILVIGQFLVLLQLVKLYEQRANRDYAQLLVLGPLLMVAGAISTYSLLFGVIFIAYIFLALYCCLLFHLKVETDHARMMLSTAEPVRNPQAVKENERLMRRSLRGLNVMIAAFAVAAAVATFLFFPRVGGAGPFGPYSWRPSEALTGFNDSVSFQNIAMITQNTQPVAWVTVTRENQPYTGTLWFRGTALDRYSGKGEAAGSTPFQWVRTLRDSKLDEMQATATAEINTHFAGEYSQQVKLDPTGTNVLFAIGGATSFQPLEGGRYRYTRYDEVLQTGDPIIQPIRYNVTSTDRLTADPWPMPANLDANEQAYIAKIDPRIREFAMRPEVSGSDFEGPLAPRRDPNARVTAVDLQIASNIETYLRSNFTYTLDLTDAARLNGQDPMVAFLYDLKRGHCEYFAGAMTLMCQSMGMSARLVVGFRCDDYNAIGNYFTVRQSHAHAWVEVLSDQGAWTRFDPTSSSEAGAASDGLWQKAKSLFNYLEYTWANAVVGYDPGTSGVAFQQMDRDLGRTASQSSEAVNGTLQWASDKWNWIFSQILGWLTVLVVLLLFGAVGWFTWQRWRLRQRAKRIGLDALPVTERVKLARQLEFYDDLVQVLDRHQLRRDVHQTPLEFSNSLEFLPVDAFGMVRWLTERFYDIRYGRVEPSETQRREFSEGVTLIQNALDAMN